MARATLISYNTHYVYCLPSHHGSLCHKVCQDGLQTDDGPELSWTMGWLCKTSWSKSQTGHVWSPWAWDACPSPWSFGTIPLPSYTLQYFYAILGRRYGKTMENVPYFARKMNYYTFWWVFHVYVHFLEGIKCIGIHREKNGLHVHWVSLRATDLQTEDARCQETVQPAGLAAEP